MAHIAQSLILSFLAILFPAWIADVLASQVGLRRVEHGDWRRKGTRLRLRAVGLLTSSRCHPTQRNPFCWGYFTSASQQLSLCFS